MHSSSTFHVLAFSMYGFEFIFLCRDSENDLYAGLGLRLSVDLYSLNALSAHQGSRYSSSL